MSEIIRVDMNCEVRPGVWSYTVTGGGVRMCGESRQPLLDACRQIKSMGGDTAQRAGLFWPGKGAPSLVCSVGWAAG